MQAHSMTRFGKVTMGVALGALALAACSKSGSDDTKTEASTTTTNEVAGATTTTTTDMTATNTAAATPAAGVPAAGAPAADNTDTLTGVKLASYTGDAAKGAVVFLQCKTCHEATAGVNKIGPSLHAVVGRKASTIPNFQYSAANHASGITWTEDKLFQYLEKPQRVVPGTKMTFVGLPDPQKRADVIAYLKTQS